MKTKLLFYLILLLGLNANAQIINVSTGVDNSGNALPYGSVDPLWQIANSPNPPGTPALVSISYPPTWEVTPIATTNANLINSFGDCCGNLPGIYTFERNFTVASGTTNFSCNFSIAYDDAFVSLELVRPDLSTVPLTVVPTTPYHLSVPITNVISSPMTGTWKIRAKVDFIDSIGFYLLSGKITMANQTIVCVPASKDTMLHEFVPTTNYGSNTVLQPSRWTYDSGGGSGFYSTKTLQQFDLSAIPSGAVITSAIMKLHVDTTAPIYNQHRDLGGGTGNGVTINQVGSAWAENTVTWNTAPSLLASSITLPSLGNGSTADVVANVTTMVQNMITSGINNGFQISLTDNSDYYHSLVFGSRENLNSGGIFQPELCITYTLPQTVVCLPAIKDTLLHEFTPTANYGTFPLLRASRHTYSDGGGSGFYTTKALNQFDLSSIPAGATIVSATMKLRVDTTPFASPYNSHYDLGGGTGNGAIVTQVATPWLENTVTWNTAPSLLASSVTLPSLGNGSTADVIANVTAMVQNMVSTGVNNGFEISLNDITDYYHGLNFASRENTSNGSAFQPELCIIYTTSPVPTVSTFTVGSSCGATISNLSVTINTPFVSGATVYLFRLKNLVTNAIQLISRPVNSFALSNLVGVTLGTSYQIEVSTNGGTTFGPPCIVKTPAPSATIGAQCGTTVTSMTQFVYCNYVPSVIGYRFKVTNTITGAVEIIDSGLNRFSFNQLLNENFNTTYTVEVALKNTNGTYLPYSVGCDITTPAFPTSEIRISQCDYTALSFTENFVANLVSGATMYRFIIFNTALGYSYAIDRPLNTFNLNMFPGLLLGTTYSVQVAVKIGSVFGPYGKVCNLTTPGVRKGIATTSKPEEFVAVAFPNPFADSFNLDIKTTSESSIQIRVYDMIGKLIEDRNCKVSDIETVNLGLNYASGVYNIIVSQDDKNQTIRMIRR
jgi:hypothetical protein